MAFHESADVDLGIPYRDVNIRISAHVNKPSCLAWKLCRNPIYMTSAEILMLRRVSHTRSELSLDLETLRFRAIVFGDIVMRGICLTKRAHPELFTNRFL